MRSARILRQLVLPCCWFIGGLVSNAYGALPQPPRLVVDGNPGQSTEGSSPYHFCKLGNISLFAATSEKEGRELWRSDGTSEGTWLVKDLAEGAESSHPHLRIEWQGAVYFWAQSGLWKTDGTAEGTVRLTDASLKLNSLYDAPFVRLGNRLCFSASTDDRLPLKAWTTDGTKEGTMLLSDAVPGFPVVGISSAVEMGGLWYLYDGNLWKSDGTTAGTVQLKSNAGSRLTRAGNTLFFRASSPVSGEELWKSDGTVQGTSMLRDINSGSTSSNIDHLTAFGDSVYFSANDGNYTVRLWKSDGTPSGTVKVSDIPSIPQPFSPENFFVFKSRLFFTAYDSNNGRQVWTSDGTARGTILFKKVSDRGMYAYPGFQVVGDQFFFATAVGENVYDSLWRSDGTPEGTVVVSPYETVRAPTMFFAFGDTLLFNGISQSHGSELWRSDGTESGTTMVRDIFTGPNSLDFGEMVTIGPRIFYGAATNSYSRNLWSSDGTPEGTPDLRERAYYDYYLNSRNTVNLTPLGNRVIYRAGEGPNPDRIRVSDGTREGTKQLKNLNGVPYYDNPVSIAKVGGTAYVFARAGDNYNAGDLWKTDGTDAGTSLVLSGGAGLPMIHRMAGADGVLYFSAGDDGGNRTWLWKSDGTAARTVSLLKINPTAGSAFLSDLKCVGDRLYFVANDGVHGSELWTSDGTTEGTRMLKDIREGSDPSTPAQLTVRGSHLFFTADDAIHGRELWITDGTSAGTKLVRDIFPGSEGASIASITTVGTTVYFGADDGISGVELWKSDGTTEGTVLLKEIVPGPRGGAVTDLAAYGASFYFAADDGVHGSELWSSDGTTGGTMMLYDIVPGPVGSLPRKLCVGQTKLYFTAYEEATGRELYIFDPTPLPEVAILPPTELSGTSVTLNGRVNPNGATTTGYLEYGTTSQYGTRMTISLPDSSSGTFQEFSVGLTNLAFDSTYHYRVVVENPGGRVSSDDQIFRTLPNQPPVWAGQTVAVFFEGEITFPMAQFYSLGSDPEGHYVSMYLSSPERGRIVWKQNAFVYKAPSGFSGTDRIGVTLTDEFGAESIGHIVIQVSGPFGHRPQPGSVTIPKNGTSTYKAEVIPDRVYVIQRSVDLISWRTIGVERADGNGKFEFSDRYPPAGKAFYRLTTP